MLQLSDTAEDLANLANQLPDIVHAAADVINRFGPLASITRSVLEDPALPQVLDRIQTIRDISQQEATDSGSTLPAGVGLSSALPLIDAYVWYRRYPWGPAVVVGGIALLIFGMGMRVGRRSQARATAAAK